MCEYPALALLVRKKAGELTPNEHNAIRKQFPGLTVRFEECADYATHDELMELCARIKPDAVFFFFSKRDMPDARLSTMTIRSRDIYFVKSPALNLPPRYIVFEDGIVII